MSTIFVKSIASFRNIRTGTGEQEPYAIAFGTRRSHGNVPDTAEACLLIIDMINEFSFPGADIMLPPALEATKRIADLKRRAKATGVPVICVNDNFGKWQYDFKNLMTHCLTETSRGKGIVELLCPDDDDYFVLKPKHSGFFSTPLRSSPEISQRTPSDSDRGGRQ